MPANRLTVSREELLDQSGDRAFRSLLYDFFAFGSHLAAARGKFADYVELSTAQYLILIAISQAPQDEGVGYVAKRLHLSSAFVTIEINWLVARKLVTKSPHRKDGRRVQLKITTKGSDLLARLAALQRPINDMLFESLTAEDFRTLCRIMRHLAAGGASAVELATHLSARMNASEDRLRPVAKKSGKQLRRKRG